MSNFEAAGRETRPVWAFAKPRLQIAGQRLVRVAPRPDFVMAGLVLWVGVYAALAAVYGRQADGHSFASDLWLLPADVAIAVAGLGVARRCGTPARDSRPWRLIGLSGFGLTVSDLVWLAADRSSPLAGDLAGAAEWLPLVALGVATLMFRPALDARRRPRSQILLDLMAVVVVAAVTVSYLDLQVMTPAAGWDQAARVVPGTAVVVAVAALARVGLRPSQGLSAWPAAILVLGVAAALIGIFATSGPVAAGGAALVGQASFAVLRAALIAASRWGPTSRRSEDTAESHGPSPLFFAAVGFGSLLLTVLAFNLGMNYVFVGASCLALSSVVVGRNFFTLRQAAQADRARRKTEARFGWLVRNSSDFIMAVDAEGTIDYVSPSVERLLHTPAHDLLDTPLVDLAHPDDVGELRSLVSRALAAPGARISGEWRIRLHDGTWLPVETVASSGSGDVDTSGVVLNTRDLQERKALEQKLVFQAFHDPLTRLANRSLFRERVEHALDRRNAADTAVMFIDLDNFKTINDSLGHAAGDHVLVEMAHRVRSSLRTEDTAARLGGDEFAVLLEDAEVTAAARVAERIRMAVSRPFWVLGQEVYVSASIGIAVRREGDTANELLRNADVAMYTAKSKGKARFELFEPAMHDVVVARLGLEAELRRGIEREEFVVHYQPIVRLETGEVIGAEALVRWQHPTRGLIQPLEFIPLAEETGLIVPLGGWVLRQACHQLAEWQKARGGGEPFVMNVNLSSRQLVRDMIADEVAEAVDESGIRASWLVLEVTETVLMADPISAATALTHIRDLGVRVALDDFGSGYSSLSHLRRFPIDIVKIDKSFVDDVAHSGAESAIARGIIELGRAMQIQTVAEGIEVDEQAEVLRTLGCELGQGFFFARPLAPADWAALLRTDLALGGTEASGGATGDPGSPKQDPAASSPAATRRAARSRRRAA